MRSKFSAKRGCAPQLLSLRPSPISFFPVRQRPRQPLHDAYDLSSNIDRIERHSWSEKISRKPSKYLIASIILALGLGWGYHRSQKASQHSLKIDRYRPFKIHDSRLLTKDTALLDINVSLPTLDPIKSLLYIESIYLKHPALQIERPYTPLSSITPTEHSQYGSRTTSESDSVINLLLKRYPQGDMSTYLHHVKAPGNQVEVRGPVPTWHHQNDNEIDELIFIAAGTGITPAIQLMRRFFKRRETGYNTSLPKFQLIYLAHSLESAYFLDEIQSYESNHPELMDLKLVISNKDDNSGPLKKIVNKVGQLEYSDIKEWVGSNNQESKKMVIVCGPESLICAVAGSKGRIYNSQAELGGMLKSLGYSSHQVVKL